VDLIPQKADKINLSSADYVAGEEVMSSFYLTGNGDRDIVPSDGLKVMFEAYYYRNGQRVSLVSMTKERLVVPANDKNLYWFKWQIPTGLEGNTVYESYTVNTDRAVEERSYSNNVYTDSFTVAAKERDSQTENPSYSSSVPNTYVKTEIPAGTSSSASWSQYAYENGRFVKHTYGLKIADSGLIISPESVAKASLVNGKWKMKSGYGFLIEYKLNITGVVGCETPGTDSYIESGDVTALYPEFNYSDATGKCSTLKWVSGKAVLTENGPLNNKRIHLIPVWFPNGEYRIAVKVKRICTPVGTINGIVWSNPITIDGSMYDDWYIGK